MGVNKLTIDGTVEFDLSSDTVTAATLAKGITAHNSIGDVITGTMESGLDTSDATATAAQILEGSTAYVDGEKLTGEMANCGEINKGFTEIQWTVSPGGYYSGVQFGIDATEAKKVIPANIKKDVSILGVTGILEEKIDTSDATATSSDILSGKTAYVDDVKVTGKCTYDADTSDATASASQILSGSTAYVNGTKLTGTLSFRSLYTSTSSPSASDGTDGDIWIITG